MRVCGGRVFARRRKRALGAGVVCGPKPKTLDVQITVHADGSFDVWVTHENADSIAARWDVAEGVRGKSTGAPGLLFYAEAACRIGNDVFVRAGYFEHGKSGMRFLMLLSLREGTWRVSEVGTTGTS